MTPIEVAVLWAAVLQLTVELLPFFLAGLLLLFIAGRLLNV